MANQITMDEAIDILWEAFCEKCMFADWMPPGFYEEEARRFANAGKAELDKPKSI